MAFGGLGDSLGLRRELRAMASLTTTHSIAPEWLVLAGTALARAGQRADVIPVREQIRERARPGNASDAYALHMVSAEMALASGTADTAAAHMAVMSFAPAQALALDVLARSRRRTGDVTGAMAAYARLDSMSVGGSDGFETILLAPLALGRLSLARGDTTRAVAYLTRFVNRWTTGNPDLIPLREGRALLDTLRRR
jgi:hypothetical protein